jgi:hypothetical protein
VIAEISTERVHIERLSIIARAFVAQGKKGASAADFAAYYAAAGLAAPERWEDAIKNASHRRLQRVSADRYAPIPDSTPLTARRVRNREEEAAHAERSALAPDPRVISEISEEPLHRKRVVIIARAAVSEGADGAKLADFKAYYAAASLLRGCEALRHRRRAPHRRDGFPSAALSPAGRARQARCRSRKPFPTAHRTRELPGARASPACQPE